MELKSFLLLLCCVCVYGVLNNQEENFELVKNALTEYLSTGVRPSYLDNALQQYQLPHIFRSNADPKALNSSQICTLCDIVTELLIVERKLGMTDVQISAEAAYFCTSLGIENERVCDGVIGLNLDIFMYIIDNNPNINGQKMCALILQENNCDKGGDFDWTVDVPEGKTVEKVEGSASKTFNILQISDIHYDPLYTPGKTNKCGEPLCCQVDQPDGTDGTNTCGYWTDYTNSDVPLHTVYETLKQTNTHDFDYVYYTGDFVSHRVWSTSVANNTRDIKAISETFRQYYTVPVYPILGNHEPNPVNIWSSEDMDDVEISTQWLFDLVAEEWSTWLPEETKTTILKGGFYTLSPKEGFRIIVLNSNVCYVVNWWLLNEDKDPYGQLAWLAGTLLQAEQNSESVHILSHIPTGNSQCLQVWSREYNRIIERFANTVTGQFNGHTHKDELSIYYNSSDSTQAINVAWNGASVTTFANSNPSYKLYQIDEDTFDVVDYEEWTFNLTLANLYPERDIEWYKLYSFKDAYGVNSLQPSEVDSLANRMAKDHTLIEKYYLYKFRNSDVAVEEGCDEACQKNLLCQMVTTVYGVTEQCDKLLELYESS